MIARCKGAAGLVFATARGATVAALVPEGFPALSEDGPQPVIVTASSAAATISRPEVFITP
jgi:hypothetical protein